jgi:hypothetical protein
VGARGGVRYLPRIKKNGISRDKVSSGTLILSFLVADRVKSVMPIGAFFYEPSTTTRAAYCYAVPSASH